MLKQLLGDPNARKLKRYSPLVTDINILEADYIPLSDDELRGRTSDLRLRLEKAGELNKQQELLDELFLHLVSKNLFHIFLIQTLKS